MPDYSQIIRGMKYKKYHDPIKIHSFFDAKKMVDLVENPECHFITGCIRSGTNWFATLFYPFTDIVFSDFEGLRSIQDRKMAFAEFSKVTFKINEDLTDIGELKDNFKNSIFYIVNRDGREIVHSIYRPNPKSVPPRDFDLKTGAIENDESEFEAAIRTWLGYMQHYDEALQVAGDQGVLVDYNKLVRNFDVEILKLFSKHFGLTISKLSELKKLGLFRNRMEKVIQKKLARMQWLENVDNFLDENWSIEERNELDAELTELARKYKDIPENGGMFPPWKTPSQDKWETWSEEEKEVFKNYKCEIGGKIFSANDTLIKYGYVKDKNW
jgi:hypothetical protein|tara:strand:+ start:3596 stop:4576 length:981 start_codon:yes stop_codon:yes gene_type:complete